MLEEAEAAGDHTFVITAPSTEPSRGLCTAAGAQAVLYSGFCRGKNLETQISSAFFKHVCCESWRQRMICHWQLGAGSLQSQCSRFLLMV